MGTINISLPDALKSFVDQQVGSRGYGTSSEYVGELIRRAPAPCGNGTSPQAVETGRT